MKKLVILLACVAGVLCSCNPQMKRANELIDEYTQKADSARVKWEVMDKTINLSEEEEAYIDAYANAYKYRTAVVVAKNWQLPTEGYQAEAVRYIARTEMLYVPLSAEKQTYASKRTEVMMYDVTVSVLQEWKKRHQ